MMTYLKLLLTKIIVGAIRGAVKEILAEQTQTETSPTCPAEAASRRGRREEIPVKRCERND